MNIYRRAVLFLSRRKGKSLLLFLIFFLVSLLLLTCLSILDGTQEAEADLRSRIGAAFYIRPYARLTLEEGGITDAAAPVISQESIEQIIDAAGDLLRSYNTEHYGYAKSSQLHFLAGAGDNADSNMGQVTAVRDSSLLDVFREEEYTLTAGRHIRPEDVNKILISAELAAENNLSVGDRITLTHAGLGTLNGEYTDTIPQKTAYAQAEIIGIFQPPESSDSADSPTAARAVNHIYSDSSLLIQLQEQEPGLYEGEIAFYISDPLALEDILRQVKELSSIDWDSHILRENDFQYRQIAGELQNLQELVLSLIAAAAVLGAAVLTLLLLLQTRGRIHEAGLYLSLGKSKIEIIGQFTLETGILLLLGFLPALLLSFACSGRLNELLFGPLSSDAIPDYLHPDLLRSLLLLGGEAAAALLAILASGSVILAFKPKEILTKMN